ncbi:hypothetical protein RND71_037489 [Anisodus tanguticus]|uniref:Glycosyl transferase family 28 C-terminal domain-containing protein n=1 Tax=Anisodus tanguticus TaxID=243964 RepID=A0AAE1V1B8_9SOLA|nr:hypothetical protein RND71_037489 [Anisodus tanguticus]
MGEIDDTVKEKRVVFVTVGTTCFDALLRAVDTLEVKNELFKKGYTDILIQMGHSHKGSGSIFETLQLGKSLIVVVNEDLMDNHQSELAEVLAEIKHLYCARPQTLYKTISDMDPGSLVPYQPGDAKPVAKLINRYLGFPED